MLIRLVHTQTEPIISELRSMYWVVKGLSIIRRELSQCFCCKRIRAQPVIPLMTALPYHRLHQTSTLSLMPALIISVQFSSASFDLR